MKKPHMRFVCKEDGTVDMEVLNTIGPSCSLDAKEYADAIGSTLKRTKKPEFFVKKDEKQKNTQTNR